MRLHQILIVLLKRSVLDFKSKLWPLSRLSKDSHFQDNAQAIESNLVKRLITKI